MKLFWLALTIATASAWAVTPQPGEFTACRQWCDTVFGRTAQPVAKAHLKLLYQDATDGISRGRSWRGTPFKLGDKEYAHGLAFNSTKHIQVKLGQPAERFTADVGLENNDDTQRGATSGHGSVTFHVLIAGKEVFKTPVLRLKDSARPLDIPLNSATEFEIRVGNGGDDRGWDQALWAEAIITLQDGTKLRLQDLPLGEAATANPFGFSFQYKGEPSTALLGHWTRTVSGEPPKAPVILSEVKDLSRSQRIPKKEILRSAQNDIQTAVTYRDDATGLEVRADVTIFRDFPAVEWVVHLKNTGTTDTPLLESIQALDTTLPVVSSGPVTLHSARGAVASFDDFAPQQTVLKPGVKVHLHPGGGRSSNQVLPFFNLEGASGGIIAAIGWTGEWAADFSATPDGPIQMKAGMAHTHLVLKPGETIRTPRMMLLFYQGDRWRGQNLLRQFLLTHHRPKRNGQPLTAPITFGSWGGTRAEVHLDDIHQITSHDLPVEYYWIDAEWYGTGKWWPSVGTWDIKRDLYPAGFKPISDALRKTGRKLLVWFEPERVFKDSAWHKAHRDWLIDIGRDSLMLNLGNPDARKFVTDFISAKIDEFGLGCYRQDFNYEPLPYWQAADKPDRQGFTEIRYIEGLYAFWDELLARHPGLIIDNCASGGRRLDLETTGRATPFWRTDGPRDAIAHQCHTAGLLPWIPLSSTSADRASDDYEFRSSMCSALCLNWDSEGHVDAPGDKIRADFPYAWAKRTLDQYVSCRQFYYGDYYPLTTYSQAKDIWQAYQLDRPDLRQGLIVALRRPQSPYHSARFQLHALDEKLSYQITNLDTGKKRIATGKELLQTGIEITLSTNPGSTLIQYEHQ